MSVCVTERETEREEDSFCFSYHPSRLCTSVIRHTHTDAQCTDTVTQEGEEQEEGGEREAET